MNEFKNFEIKPIPKGFEGDKIKIMKLVDQPIIVHFYKLGDSKVFADRGTGLCLKLQITFNNEKRLLFTSSSFLINQIQQIPEEGFPFKATIIKEGERYLFT